MNPQKKPCPICHEQPKEDYGRHLGTLWLWKLSCPEDISEGVMMPNYDEAVAEWNEMVTLLEAA